MEEATITELGDDDIIDLGEPIAYIDRNDVCSSFSDGFEETAINIDSLLDAMGYIPDQGVDLSYILQEILSFVSFESLQSFLAKPNISCVVEMDHTDYQTIFTHAPFHQNSSNGNFGNTTNQFLSSVSPTSHTQLLPDFLSSALHSQARMPARSPSYYSSRTRSRTRSPYTPRTRGRSRSRSPDSRYSRGTYYSDSFHSDDSRGRGRRSRSRTPPRDRGGPYSKSKSVGALKSKVTIPKFRGVPKKKPLKKGGAATSTPRPVGAQDMVTRRMLSARRLKINELRNEIDTLMKALEEIRLENKSLKRDNVLQNKQLDRLQDQEGELPQMIETHNREVRALKEQIRKWREKTERINKSLRNAEDELSRSQRKIKKLQGIADDKKLEERDELSRRLGKSENELAERTAKVQQLERHIENLEKSHRREIHTEMKKHASTKLELQTLQVELEYTKTHLRDREKELEVRNIYQNRIALAQRKGSVSSLPALEPPARYQPPPKSPEISPRQRVKQFEQKRREEQKAKAKEQSVRAFESPNSSAVVPPIKSAKPSDHQIASNLTNNAAANQTQKQRKTTSIDASPRRQDKTIRHAKDVSNGQSQPPIQFSSQSQPSKQSSSQPIKSETPKPPDTPKFEKQDSWEAIMKKQKQISGQQASVTKDSLEGSFNKSRDDTFVKSEVTKSFFTTEIPEDDARLADEQRRRQQEEENRRKQQEEENRRREEEDRRQKEKEDRARRDREERERAREEKERYEREHQQRQKEEREAKEREQQRAQEAAERERRFREDEEQLNAEKEAEERARVAREQEKQRLERDAKAAEERRKKDLLLQKMREIDTGSSGTPPTLGSKSKPQSFGNSNSKDLFSGGDFFLTSGDDRESSAKAKEYSFRQTDENLYRGLPAKKPGARNSSLFGDEVKKGNPLFSSKKDSLFDDDDVLDFGGYQPSSLGNQNKQSKARPQAEENNTWKVKDSAGGSSKKANFNDDIFGSGSQSKKPFSLFDDNDDIFAPSQKSKPTGGSERKSEFSWESNSKPVNNDKVLPLRPRADNTTIHNKPTVRAFDDFDDDLEEVVL